MEWVTIKVSTTARDILRNDRHGKVHTYSDVIEFLEKTRLEHLGCPTDPDDSPSPSAHREDGA